jgi:hypothetical protein
MRYFKRTILPLSILTLIGFNFIGCGNSSSTTERTTFDKAYYEKIDYSNIDKLSKQFLEKDPRFVDLKTEIPLPTISVQAWDKNYTIETIQKGITEEGKYVIQSITEDFIYEFSVEGNLTFISIDDTKDANELVTIAFDKEHITTTADPDIEDMSIKSYKFNSFTIVIPEIMDANGNAIIEYNKKEDFAIIRDGDLGLNAFNKMVDITQNYPNIKTIVLKNIDGSVHDAINMQTGLLVRKAKLATFVEDTEGDNTDIASGGVDLFTAGLKRDIENEESVKLGIHSWAEGKIEGRDFPKEHKRHHDQLLYFSKMLGVDKGYDFYFHTLEVAEAEDMHIMTDDEINEFDILTKD